MDQANELVAGVAIGRNEGKRLERCLRSLRTCCSTIVYVDSGSSDGSVELAHALGANIVHLDQDQPFTAARARNAGWRRALDLDSSICFIQFVDGDCELKEGWIEAGLRLLGEKTRVAIVSGRRRERFPNASIYNFMMDQEWDSPIGDVEACGGDTLVRVSALESVEGFDDSVSAGEEPELCLRLRNEGWRIRRLDHEMTVHDAAMSRFQQWWRRQVRSGYGAMDVTYRFHVEVFRKELWSSRIWTIGWLLGSVLIATIGTFMFALPGAIVGLSASLLLGFVQVIRISAREYRKGLGLKSSIQIALILLASKFACLKGQVRWMFDQKQGVTARQIEYKRVGGQASQ